MSAGNCPIFQNEVLHAVVDRICDMCHEMFRNADPNLRAKCRYNMCRKFSIFIHIKTDQLMTLLQKQLLQKRAFHHLFGNIQSNNGACAANQAHQKKFIQHHRWENIVILCAQNFTSEANFKDHFTTEIDINVLGKQQDMLLPILIFLLKIAFVSSVIYEKYYAGLTSVTRTYVPPDKASWKVPFPYYSPAYYSAPCDANKRCDPEILNPMVKFNSIDNNVDRRSTGKKYSINEEGFPLNPNGRTGVQGRGILPFYGPNFVVVSLITRSSQPIEYLAIKNADTDLDILDMPAEFVTMPDSVKITPKTEKAIKEIMLKSYANKTIEEIFSKVTKKPTLLFRGTLDDERNTDNAWIEAILIQLTDSNVRKLGLAEVDESNNPLGLHWTPLDISELKAQLQRLVAQAHLSIADSAMQQAREFAWDMRDQGTAGKFKTFVNILANGVTVVNIVLTTASLAG
ncbi:ADP-ribose pyrophosphatase, mitochondrial [Trichinella pseudospiralis]|uniref:ADP-ribose pyrophosphatase, mitochondrial n=1 Tax=Trichinella pseudospiralis TaxID=6337 RepID=A0A0V1EG83_TRIPS|nr:ADP-ribose pyrophosphatase, mitochondrial [Trichinella pseudospiralis]